MALVRCGASDPTVSPLSQAAHVAQVNLSPLVFPGWAQIRCQIKAKVQMNSDQVNMLFRQVREVNISRQLNGPTSHLNKAQNNFFFWSNVCLLLLQVILKPTSTLSVYIEPELNQFHSFFQHCPEETSQLHESRFLNLKKSKCAV